MTTPENPDETTYIWGSFIWKTEETGEITEVDPFHIRAWGKVKGQDEQGKPMIVVWCDVGGRTLTKRFYNQPGFVGPCPIEAELDRIRNAKMRN